MAGVCGKDCKDCDYRQRYGCRGCLESGGNPVWGSCRAAACCHSQGMQNCGECASCASCLKPGDMERIRTQWEQEEQARRDSWREGLARREPVMTQWLPVLFWIGLITAVLNLIGELPLSQGLSLLLNVVQLGLGVGALVAYWKLAVLSGRLRLVWRLQLAGQVVSLAVIGAMLPALFNEEMALPLGGLGLAAALAVAVIALVVQYHFCEGMAEELEQSDPPGVTQGFSSGGGAALAGSWRLLRRCVFWSLGALAAMVVLALIIGSGLGILLLLGALAAALVLAGCAVAQLVMLWKSAGFFRDLPPLYAPLPPGEENAGL